MIFSKKDKFEILSLPRIHVSFQDHFCGCADEITHTVRYVFGYLSDMGIAPYFGLKLLLWEDDGVDAEKYYIYQIGRIVPLTYMRKRRYYTKTHSQDSFVKIGNKLAMIEINKKNYLYFPDLKSK